MLNLSLTLKLRILIKIRYNKNYSKEKEIYLDTSNLLYFMKNIKKINILTNIMKIKKKNYMMLNKI